MLHRHRLVGRRKDGLHVYYRIADPSIFTLCELVYDGLAEELAAERRLLSRGAP